MSKTIKKVLMVLMAIMLAIPVLTITEVEAATPKAKGVKIISAGSSYELEIKLPKKLKQKQVKMSKSKSSNEKVISVPVGYYNSKTGIYSISGYSLKSGKAKISFNLKVKNKTYKYSMTITAKKYVNPFKSFKLDKKEFAAKFNKKTYVPYILKGSKTVKIVPKKNWKLVSIKGLTGPGAKPVIIKNGDKISINDGYWHICVTMKNQKRGITQEVIFY